MFQWITESVPAAGSTKYVGAIRCRSTLKHHCFSLHCRQCSQPASAQQNNITGLSKDVNLYSVLTWRTFALFHCVVAHLPEYYIYIYIYLYVCVSGGRNWHFTKEIVYMPLVSAPELKLWRYSTTTEMAENVGIDDRVCAAMCVIII